MWIARTVAELREKRHALKGKVGFVPTMGALHEGHLSLVRQAKALGDHVLVSIFVNPTQFGPNEDLSRYPRPVERDLAMCEQEGVAGVFLPSVEEMYPPDEVVCKVSVPQLSHDLEGAKRPGHFDGVCQVVAKLLNMTQPDYAVFGRKDYQQLKVIQAMTRSLALPIEIVPGETVREDDGLALSSRNVYLSQEQRQQGLALSRALRWACEQVREAKGISISELEQGMRSIMEQAGVEPDYAAVRNEHDVTAIANDKVNPQETRLVALVAGRVGQVRLIDNMTLA